MFSAKTFNMGHQHISDLHLDQVYARLQAQLEFTTPVFTVKNAASWQISRSEILALQRRGHVYKIRHGSYCLTRDWTHSKTDEPLRRRLIAAAVMVAMREPVFACGPFAGELHQLPLPAWEPSGIELVRDVNHDLRPGRRRLKPANCLDGVTAMCRDLSGEEVTQIMGIPCVGLPGAAVTAAARLPREYAIALFDQAHRFGVSRQQLLDECERWASSRGVRASRMLIPAVRSQAESPLESISRVRLMDRGIPEPVLQHEIHDARGFVGRVDMWWPQWGVIGEADGLGKYDELSVLRAEKVREDRLRALGLSVVRWTWDEIWDSPADVVARILAASRWSTYGRSAG